jgi:Sec-independent protein translocase protein TatA
MSFLIENSWWLDSCGMVLSPWQIGLAVLIGLMVFAPHLLPPFGRFLGRLVGIEVKRRTGFAPSKMAKRAEPVIEILPPEEAPKPLRTQQAAPIDVATPDRKPIPVWQVTVLIGGVVSGLLWLLLHQR